MSWFTVGEIVVWLALAAALGVVLGWLLHVAWSRRGTAAPSPVTASSPVTTSSPVAPSEPPPAADPAQPGEPEAGQQIKGNQKSMIYHLPSSPAYQRTNADAWFDTEAEAVAAGYRKPRNQ